jgi:hypothetical protein
MKLIDADAAIAAVEWGITRATLINIETGEKTHPFDTINEELQKAIERIKKLPTVEPKQEWISVNDRLPEMHHVVLAFSPHHNNIWALSLHEDGFWYYWMDVTRRYDPLWMGPITRWMPLPEPPKEDNDG